MRSVIAEFARAALFSGLASVAGAAVAQVHEQDFGRYVIRANVVHSTSLPESVLKKHDLESDPERAFLNVVVLRGRSTPQETAPATVIANVREPGGYTRDVDMRAVSANGRVSWMGAFPILAPRAALDFTVTAFAEADTALTMEFTERVYRRQHR